MTLTINISPNTSEQSRTLEDVRGSWEITLASLLKLAGVKRASSHHDYAQWLDYDQGQYLEPQEVARALLMVFWCKVGSARRTSKKRFIALEENPKKPSPKLTQELNKYHVYQRIRQSQLHELGDFSLYGF